MNVALHEERLLKMRLKLLPFRRDPSLQQPLPTIADAKNVMGVLQFGTKESGGHRTKKNLLVC